MERDPLAAEISDRMAPHALPDCRFGRDYSAYIPGFAEAGAAAVRLIEALAPPAEAMVFVTPDNSLQPLRERLLRRGHPLVLPTYGLMRGFLVVEPAADPLSALARSWLEGAEHFGRLVTLGELATGPQIALHVVGAAAVARNGVRFGMGHRYFDAEFAMLLEVGITPSDAPIVVPVHPVQVHDGDLPARPGEVLATHIATPEGVRSTGASQTVRRLDPALIPRDLLEAAPVRECLARRRDQP